MRAVPCVGDVFLVGKEDTWVAVLCHGSSSGKTRVAWLRSDDSYCVEGYDSTLETLLEEPSVLRAARRIA